jgi:hypothetical protein
MKTRTNFAHRLDLLDDDGELLEHLAGVDDFILADALPRSSAGPMQRSCYAEERASFTTAAARGW